MKRKPGVEPREQRIYYDVSAPPARNIVDQRPMPARTLGAVGPVEQNGDPRRALAAWLTSPHSLGAVELDGVRVQSLSRMCLTASVIIRQDAFARAFSS